MKSRRNKGRSGNALEFKKAIQFQEDSMKFTLRTLPTTILCVSLACGAALAQAQSPASGTFNPRHELASIMRAQPNSQANHQTQAPKQGSSDLSLTFGMIDFPGQPASDASGINDKGEIVGGYGSAFDSAFLLRGTKFTQISYPGAAWTDAYAINDAGVIIGGYGTSLTDAQGFELTGKAYSAINYPGAASTYALGINKHGDVVGAWEAEPDNYPEEGFLLSKGTFTNIAYPGAIGTIAYSINAAGAIVGTYGNSDGSTHGFLLQNGTYTTIDYPGGYSQNYLAVINDNGVIVGGYGDPVTLNGAPWDWEYCFVYQNGQFTQFVAPFGPPVVTMVYGLNNKGDVVGAYADSSGTWYGYEATIAQ
jgi:probable HAF family extracellular repeat protein